MPTPTATIAFGRGSWRLSLPLLSAEWSSRSICCQPSARLLPALVDLALQPGLSQRPLAHHRAGRNAQDFRRLFNAQTAKEAQFNHPALALVEFSQRGQRLVERDHLRRAFVRDLQGFVESDLLRATAALLILPRARVIHQDAPHQ